jgi:hypothetical protein
VFSALCLAWLAGCSYTTVYQNPAGNVVQAGMTMEQVRAAWGEPKLEVNDLLPLSILTDAWEYDFATVYFIQNSIVHQILVNPPKYKGDPSPASNMAGGGRP